MIPTLSSRRLLPHELCFGGFLVLTWIRLVAAAGFFNALALVWLAGLTLNGWLIVRSRRSPSAFNWRLCLLFYPIAMNVTFALLGAAVAKFHPGSADAGLQRIDAALVGTNLSLRLQPFVHPVLTEFFSACYFLFFPFLGFSLVYYFVGEITLLRKFCVGLFSIYGLGFIGYTLVPARGPWIAMAEQFHVPLTGWAITRANDAVVRAGSNGVDVFPSLHCAISTYLLLFDRWHRRWRYRIYLVPCVGLWLSTIYLRYHYFVDCLCGFALAAIALWWVRPERGADPLGNPSDLCTTPSALTK